MSDLQNTLANTLHSLPRVEPLRWSAKELLEMGGIDTKNIQFSSEEYFEERTITAVGYDGDSGDGRRHNTEDTYKYHRILVKKEGEIWHVALGEMSLEDTFQYESRIDVIYNLFTKGTPSEKISLILSRVGGNKDAVKNNLIRILEEKERECQERLRTWLANFKENPLFSYLDPKIRKKIIEDIRTEDMHLRPKDIERALNEARENIQKIENGEITATHFGGHFKTYGNKNNNSYLVLRGNGSVRPPDLVYLSKRKSSGWKEDPLDIAKSLGEDGYPTGEDEAYWSIVGPDELAIRLSRKKENDPWEYHEEWSPHTLTEEQRDALKRLQMGQEGKYISQETRPLPREDAPKKQLPTDPSTQNPFAGLADLMGKRK